jgi:predicted nucleotidyltransferase component of viral defense system
LAFERKGPFNGLRVGAEMDITEKQKTRVRLMENIAQEITARHKDNFVLKGGTGLLLAYSLDRFSMDLDYDGKDIYIDLNQAIAKGAASAGAELSTVNLAKNTSTVKRYKIHYQGSEYEPLILEISFRDKINEHEVTSINGIRVYDIGKLSELKINAFNDRMKARDIYDIAFLLDNYADKISKNNVLSIVKTIQDVGIDMLSDIMRKDDILSLRDTDSIAINMEERANEILRTGIAREPRENDTTNVISDDLHKHGGGVATRLAAANKEYAEREARRIKGPEPGKGKATPER